MVFCDGWPEMKVTKESAWDDPEGDSRSPDAHIIDNFYPAGGTVIRAMAAKLKAGGVIAPHRDTHQTFHAQPPDSYPDHHQSRVCAS